MIYSKTGTLVNDDGTPIVVPIDGNLPSIANQTVSPSLVSGGQSYNYVPGSSGWCIFPNGNVEFASGNFRGDITGASGTFSGTLSGATITGGTIVGSNIETSVSGNRTTLDSNNITFYNGSTEEGFIRPDATKNMVIGTKGHLIVSDLNGVPNIDIDSNGGYNMAAEQARFYWPSGRTFYSTGSALKVNGDFDITGTYGRDGHFSNCGHIQEGNVDTFSIEIRNGIIINFNKNS